MRHSYFLDMAHHHMLSWLAVLIVTLERLHGVACPARLAVPVNLLTLWGQARWLARWAPWEDAPNRLAGRIPKEHPAPRCCVGEACMDKSRGRHAFVASVRSPEYLTGKGAPLQVATDRASRIAASEASISRPVRALDVHASQV